ncbi:MAG TPA: ice-binding family protein [Tepidisphaeraceae bacterium]|nr:ice-binding family protein [Tepidisphaeraceae bacterium]
MFAVLAGSTITNTGPTVIIGDVGLSPGTSVVGFPPGAVVPPGTMHVTDAAASQAQLDLASAYIAASGAACASSNNLSGQDLGGLTLTPGVYCFASSAQLTGTLTLNALNNPDAVFDIQIGSTLTTASNSVVVFENGVSPDNVIWKVGSSATLGTDTQFAGNILALTSITLTTGADIQCGSALARNGAVTLDTNEISRGGSGCEIAADSTVPESSTALLLGTGLLLGLLLLGWRSQRRPLGI